MKVYYKYNNKIIISTLIVTISFLILNICGNTISKDIYKTNYNTNNSVIEFGLYKTIFLDIKYKIVGFPIDEENKYDYLDKNMFSNKNKILKNNEDIIKENQAGSASVRPYDESLDSSYETKNNSLNEDNRAVQSFTPTDIKNITQTDNNNTALTDNNSIVSDEEDSIEATDKNNFSITDNNNLAPSEKDKVTSENYNMYDIDFDNLNIKKKNIIEMNDIIKNFTPTKKNKYTGFFKDKMLIQIVAEAFSPYVIDEELTQTLYKMSKSGFVCNNFYMPELAQSTTGGEFVSIFGLVPTIMNNMNSMLQSSLNYLPFTLAHKFNKIGYKSFAYHPTYDYYDRNLTHPALGFDFKGRQCADREL